MKEKIIFTNGLIDLAQPRLGTKVLFKTDDFFASADRIISPTDPIFKVGVFDKNGKWMDGWESRRKRTSGHDFIILKIMRFSNRSIKSQSSNSTVWKNIKFYMCKFFFTICCKEVMAICSSFFFRK